VNYKKHYDALIQRARHRVLEGYSEKHHVLPRCLGGNDDPNNIVKLTAEEHYVAHQLLVKLNPGNPGLIYAACVMAHSPINKRVNNKLYGWLKRELSKLQSKKFSGRVWTQEQNARRSETVKRQWENPEARAKKLTGMVGKTWSPERRSAKSAAMKGKPSFMKGKPGRVWTQEQKDKVSQTMKMAFLNKQLLKEQNK
jgi:hypothetical protein